MGEPHGDCSETVSQLLFVCMRQANTAIIRAGYPRPTVDEVLQDLNQSTVYSKLDLRLGFHQLELHEYNRISIRIDNYIRISPWFVPLYSIMLWG